MISSAALLCAAAEDVRIGENGLPKPEKISQYFL